MKRLPYSKDYLNWWYFEGGAHNTIFGLDSVSGDPVVGDAIAKAIGPWDAPTSPYADYFEPVFSATVQAYVERATEVYKLLPKTTFQMEGDSLKYWETDLTGLQGVTYASTPFASGSAESGPTIVSLEQLRPAYVVDPWETSLMSRTEAGWQNSPRLNPAWLKTYHSELLPNQIDKQLTKTIDTPCNDGSTYNIESIDRICSGYAEADTNYVSVATDPDIWWGKSSVLIDRSGDTDDTFGCGAGNGLDIATSERVLTLDMIDDVVTEIIPYSKNKRYIAITGPKTMNEIQRLIDPKQRYLDSPMDVQFTMNGVSTRPGARGGFSVASFLTNGIQIPFFTSRHIAQETSGNRSSTIGSSDAIGNIYFLDLDHIEFRMAIPTTYLETPPSAMLTGDVLKTRHMLMLAGQLLCTNFRPQGAIKYLKKS